MAASTSHGAQTEFSRGLIRQTSVKMDTKFSTRKWSAVIAIALVVVSGCGWVTRRVKVGEQFTLKPGEKVSISGADLSIKLKAVGHQWYVDRRADSPYVELILSDVGASGRNLTLSETANVGEYTIKLVGANPFGDNGGPDCKLIVTRR